MAGLKILIVDDDEGDRRLIKMSLRDSSLDCDMTEAVDLADAYAKLESDSYDCVFLDYRMPGEDGIEGVKKISVEYPHSAVIMLTGETNHATAVEALKSGAADFLSKDFINEASLEHAVINAMDKTKLKRLAEAHREDLERFANMLAHDLKSPIGHLASFIDLMVHDLKESQYERLPNYIEPIEHSIKNLLTLLQTLTQFTTSNAAVEFVPVDLNLVVNDVREVLSESIQQRNAQIAVGELPTVKGNGPLLQQLLQNLVANALKFCDRDQPVIRIEANPQGDAVVLAVIDNGIGIPEDAYQKIFKPFNRLHGKNKYPGTGLGLATCKRIIERHDGRIWCESTLGEGTAFKMELPAAE